MARLPAMAVMLATAPVRGNATFVAEGVVSVLLLVRLETPMPKPVSAKSLPVAEFVSTMLIDRPVKPAISLFAVS